jgi:hypothetical protein
MVAHAMLHATVVADISFFGRAYIMFTTRLNFQIYFTVSIIYAVRNITVLILLHEFIYLFIHFIYMI